MNLPLKLALILAFWTWLLGRECGDGYKVFTTYALLGCAITGLVLLA